MKTAQHFGLIFLMMAAVQIIICNCFHLSAYVSLSVLPAMVLFIPLNIGTVLSMLIAFGTGLAVDALGEGLIGLNALALVPVALLRIPVTRLVFGEDVIERQEDISFRKFGAGKIATAILIMQALFLAVYIIADGAGTRPFWFNAARFAASLASGCLLSMIAASVLLPDTKK